MNIRNMINRYTLLTALFCAGVMPVHTAQAAPIAIEDSPLFLLNSAKPNIFFVFDDSGSMDTEVTTTSSEKDGNWGYLITLTEGSDTKKSYRYVFDHSLSYNDQSVNDYVVPHPDLINAANNAADAASTARPFATGNILTKTWKAYWSGFNKTYYDPEVTYKPWPGFSDADPLTANQYNNPTTTTVSLIDYREFEGTHPDGTRISTHDFYPAQYYYWADNGNGVIDSGEDVQIFISDGGDSKSSKTTLAGSFVVGDKYEIVSTGTTDFTLIGAASNSPGTVFTATGAGSGNGTASAILARPTASVQCGTSGTGATPTSALPCTKRAYADEIKNFANWFVYYRKRVLTAKAAMGLAINDPFSKNTRMGMASISDTSASEKELKPMYDESLTPADTHKSTLLTTLFSTNVSTANSAQTPLKEALDKAGKYYKCETSFFPDNTCAIEGMTNKTTYAANSAGECQQNYTIMITDGGYTDDNGNYHGDADKDTSTPTDGYQFDGPPYEDSEPNSGNQSTLADIAMHYYKHDMFSSLIPNKVPISCGVDENPGQHMVTYTVTFGVNGNLTWANMPDRPIATTACGTPGTATAPAWPTGLTSFSIEEKLDDTLHAAYNGRGKHLSASSAKELVDSLNASLLDIAGRKGVSSAIGLSSTNNTGNTQAYLATFNSGGWYGELSAYTINSNGTLAASASWGAHTNLNALSHNEIYDPGSPQVTASNVSALNTEYCSRASAGDPYCDSSDPLYHTYYKADDNTLQPTKVRAIVTSDPSTTAETTKGYGFGRPFRWADIPAALQNDLKTNSAGGVDAVEIGKERLNYIRGDHRCEIGADLLLDKGCTVSAGFRQRNGASGSTRLGDLVNSTPVYVGEPVGSYPDSAPFPNVAYGTYKDFKAGTTTTETVADTAFSAPSTTAANNRTPVLYIGGNDGMLHAFNASTGSSKGNEVFAFVPRVFANNTTSSGLHKLTEQNAHRSYVDMTPTIADAYTATPRDTTRRWRTVLVGGLRNGGKGIYALDITDPDEIINASGSDAKETAASKKVMWEFTDSSISGDTDLGNTFSQPVIVPLRVDAGSTPIGPSNTDNAIEWFVVFGNGYNSTSGEAVLYLLKLSGPGANNTWDAGEYYKIHTGVGDNTDAKGNNGLSSPAVIDYDGDGIYDRAYAGDLWGNMWAFDLTGTGSSANEPDNWKVAFKSGTTLKPLAIAKDSADKPQPILTKPVITRNSEAKTGSQPRAMVLFGTGRYLVDGDQKNTDKQTFYGIYDDDSAYDMSRTSTAAVLVAKTPLTTTETNVRTIDPTTTKVDYKTPALKHHGWYYDLPDSGERVTEKATLVGSTLFFSSIVPSATSPCSGGGYSWLNAFNPFTGEAPGIQVFNTNNDSIIDATDIASDFSTANVTTSGVKNSEMVPVFSYLSDQATSPSPCQSGGSSVQGIGSSTNANVSTQQLCAEGGSGKAGRYSWRQLSFD